MEIDTPALSFLREFISQANGAAESGYFTPANVKEIAECLQQTINYENIENIDVYLSNEGEIRYYITN